MTIRPISVTHPLHEMERFDRLSDAFFPTRSRVSVPQGSSLPLDVFEKDGRVVVRASMPGLKPEDVEVSIDDRVLTVSGTLGFDEEHKDARVFVREIATGSFSRSIRLPDDVDTDKAEATFENGMVSVTFPRLVETKPTPVRVPVKPVSGP